jgi:GH15 family glucan-1,4-alpha-glucosidase
MKKSFGASIIFCLEQKMYPHGLIGNCQTSALISKSGSIDWLCWPRPDSPPVFGRLLDEDGGFFSVESVGASHCEQHYIPNSVVLTTIVNCEDGSSFKITDFCPRFDQHGRMFRPNAVFRIVAPISGRPQIRVRCRPVNGWEKEAVKPVRGNSHLRFDVRGDAVRLLSNMSLTYLIEETTFSLIEPIYLALTWGYSIEEELAGVTAKFLKDTLHYWNVWVKHCSIPTLFQKETIRSALTLKLHCFEDTGAILAGLTTSLPEERGSTRNWDYRFCWLRDAYYVVTAFNNLGHFEEMEGFLKFLLNIAEKNEDSRERLRPVYRLDQTLPLPEKEHPNWSGFFSSKPVRSDNQAAEHIQNDVYGEMILSLSRIFFDERFHHFRTKEHEDLLAHLGRFCIKNISKPDAGLWEIRDGWQEHSFSNLMCWAGVDRLMAIRKRGFLKDLDLNLEQAKISCEEALKRAIKNGSLRNGPKDDSIDAALLQIADLQYPDKEVCKNTINKIYNELRIGNEGRSSSFLFRYVRRDDFGKPQSAFVICSFWLIQALVRIGRLDEAMKVMNDAMTSANDLGLFAEHYLPNEKHQSGNFPQAYSHVGQINAAFSVSPSWNDLL